MSTPSARRRRDHRIALELADNPTATLADLAQLLGVSTKTIQRSAAWRALTPRQRPTWRTAGEDALGQALDELHARAHRSAIS